ncbi:MAG: hypothetical protein ACYTGP_02515 [Planctomycetota bacterium]|jgi:hypothetical protein
MIRRRTAAAVTTALLLAIGCGESPEPAGGVAKGTSEPPSRRTAAGEGILSNGGTYYVVCRMMSDPVPLNETFDLRVTVYDAEERRTPLRNVVLLVDGRMPHHKHGMNREPTITQRADGAWAVEGMLFHMPGFWELHLDVVREGMTERAQLEVNLQ